MSRVQFSHTVVAPIGANGLLIPLAGVGATPFSVNTDGSEGAQAPAFDGRTGNTSAQSLVTDASGTVSFWLDPGEYNIHLDDQNSPPRINSYIRGFAATPFSISQLLAANQPPPIGQITQYGGSSDPVDPDGTTRWMICDGRIIDRQAHSVLFNAIGSTYGAGDGSTTFAVPDLRSRSPLGARGSGVTGLSARSLGAVGGEELHALAIAELAAHDHGAVTGGMSADHIHNVVGSTSNENIAHSHTPAHGGSVVVSPGNAAGQSSFGLVQTGGAAEVPMGTDTLSTESANHAHLFNTDSGGASSGHTHTVSSQGSGSGHNNMSPFLVCNFIIKVL